MREISDSCQAIIKQSLGSHQIVILSFIEQPMILTVTANDTIVPTLESRINEQVVY